MTYPTCSSWSAPIPRVSVLTIPRRGGRSAHYKKALAMTTHWSMSTTRRAPSLRSAPTTSLKILARVSDYQGVVLVGDLTARRTWVVAFEPAAPLAMAFGCTYEQISGTNNQVIWGTNNQVIWQQCAGLWQPWPLKTCPAAARYGERERDGSWEEWVRAWNRARFIRWGRRRNLVHVLIPIVFNAPAVVPHGKLMDPCLLVESGDRHSFC